MILKFGSFVWGPDSQERAGSTKSLFKINEAASWDLPDFNAEGQPFADTFLQVTLNELQEDRRLGKDAVFSALEVVVHLVRAHTANKSAGSTTVSSLLRPGDDLASVQAEHRRFTSKLSRLEQEGRASQGLANERSTVFTQVCCLLSTLGSKARLFRVAMRMLECEKESFAYEQDAFYAKMYLSGGVRS